MVIGPEGKGLCWPFNNSSAGESHPIDAPYETFKKKERERNEEVSGLKLEIYSPKHCDNLREIRLKAICIIHWCKLPPSRLFLESKRYVFMDAPLLCRAALIELS